MNLRPIKDLFNNIHGYENWRNYLVHIPTWSDQVSNPSIFTKVDQSDNR